ncbi:MAG: flagellar basal body P-ring formation protein FlgA [Alphaproteobacteria bacterium]|nr:flagellar basal body P-ring formation protein FlgA [Alphaproteobacteria bacterium]
MKSLPFIALLSIVFFFPSSVRAEAEFDLQALPVVLKEKSSVTDEYIRLGDLFSGLDDKTDKKVAAPAPALGKEAVLTAEWLKKLAKTHKIAWEAANDKNSVTVRREAAEINKDEVVRILMKELKAQGMPDNAELTFQKDEFPILVPVKSVWRLEPAHSEYNPARRQFEARLGLFVNDEKKQELSFAGKVRVFIQVPVAARDLKAGQIITADDILTKRVAQEASGRASDQTKAEDLIGKEVKRPLRSGQTIQTNDVRAQVMVAKGKIVTLNFAKGGIILSAQGKALENGGLGDTVRVMNSQSKTVVQGTVTGPETVSIHTTGKKP